MPRCTDATPLGWRRSDKCHYPLASEFGAFPNACQVSIGTVGTYSLTTGEYRSSNRLVPLDPKSILATALDPDPSSPTTVPRP